MDRDIEDMMRRSLEMNGHVDLEEEDSPLRIVGFGLLIFSATLSACMLIQWVMP